MPRACRRRSPGLRPRGASRVRRADAVGASFSFRAGRRASALHLRDTARAMSQENVEAFKRGLEAGNRGDVETLLQAIDQGKRPVRFGGIFDQEDTPQ